MRFRFALFCKNELQAPHSEATARRRGVDRRIASYGSRAKARASARSLLRVQEVARVAGLDAFQVKENGQIGGSELRVPRGLAADPRARPQEKKRS
jgi:hypothetical protein